MADIWILWWLLQEGLLARIITTVHIRIPQRAVWFTGRTTTRTRMAVCRMRARIATHRIRTRSSGRVSPSAAKSWWREAWQRTKR